MNAYKKLLFQELRVWPTLTPGHRRQCDLCAPGGDWEPSRWYLSHWVLGRDIVLLRTQIRITQDTGHRTQKKITQDTDAQGSDKESRVSGWEDTARMQFLSDEPLSWIPNPLPTLFPSLWRGLLEMKCKTVC